ncbi:MAG: PAS domain S-box protein, partial [Bryobacteraceae bacterium]|nr:PAS domain S-box protein [Bryobacteraceae bacterium]
MVPVSLEAVLGSTKDGYWQCDIAAGRVFASSRLRELLGYPPAPQGHVEAVRFPDLDQVHPDDRVRVARDFEQMVARRQSDLTHEYRLRTGGGGWLWVQGRTRVLEWDPNDRPRLMCGWVSDTSRRRLLEQALGTLLEKRSSASLYDLLQEAALQLTKVLGVRFAHIGRISPGGGKLRTLVVIRDGAIADNYEYSLRGSPCEVTVRESICAYPRGVQALFPEDRGLARLNVESYLGIVLRSRRNEAIGILAAMHDQPLERSEIPEALITLLAERLARELELEETENALERQMVQSHSMLEHAVDGLGLLKEHCDSAGRLVDLEWMVVNRALAGHLGDDCGNLIGQKLRGRNNCCEEALFEMVIALDSQSVVDRQLPHPNGRWYQLRVYRQAPGIVGVTSSDITERRAAEQAIQASERWLRGMMANLSQAALVLDTNGVVRFANRAVLDLVGGTEQDVLGVNWFERFLPLDERLRVGAVLSEVGGLANCPPHGTNRVVRLNGEERLVEWDLHQLPAPSGQVEAIAAIGRDITDARRLEERARLAQRMDAVGRLAGGVAHDFNNLLTVINGYVRMAIAKSASEAVRGYLEEIERAGAKAADLTRQLLALSRKQVMQARDFEAHKIVRAMEPLLARLLGPGIFLDLELAASNDWVHFDPNAIEQVLLTLGARAREVAHEGGAVKLSTACVTGPQAVQGGVLPEGGYLRLRFEDDGEGMTSDSISRLFEPFSDVTGGLRPGLELATVYGVLSQGGGGVNVESGDWGSRFDLYFRSAPPKPSPHPVAARSRLATGAATVLLVEDQDQVRAFAADALKEAGIQVVAVADAAT